MGINPLSTGKNYPDGQKKQENKTTGDCSFAKTLIEFTHVNEQNDFEKRISSPEYLQEQIERLEGLSENEDHETYIDMLKYFKEEQK